jgi:hypothetical protein
MAYHYRSSRTEGKQSVTPRRTTSQMTLANCWDLALSSAASLLAQTHLLPMDGGLHSLLSLCRPFMVLALWQIAGTRDWVETAITSLSQCFGGL